MKRAVRTVVMEEINVDYAGKIWDGSKMYEMVIISQFDEFDKEVLRKTFYFRDMYDLSLTQARYILANFPNASKLSAIDCVVLQSYAQ